MPSFQNPAQITSNIKSKNSSFETIKYIKNDTLMVAGPFLLDTTMLVFPSLSPQKKNLNI